MKPHKYADVIKAWADGAEVEYFNPAFGKWLKEVLPDFCEQYEWRVKPQKQKYRVVLLKIGERFMTTTQDHEEYVDIDMPKEFVRYLTDWVEYDAE